MSEVLANTPDNQTISLEEVAQLPAMFERVVENQMAGSVVELLLIETNKEIKKIQRSIEHFQQLKGGIYAGVTERLYGELAQLLERRQSLEKTIQASELLRVTMGQLAVARANLEKLDAVIDAATFVDHTPEPIVNVGAIDISIPRVEKMATVELEVPAPIVSPLVEAKSQPVIEAMPMRRFGPRPVPQGIGAKLRPVKQHAK